MSANETDTVDASVPVVAAAAGVDTASASDAAAAATGVPSGSDAAAASVADESQYVSPGAADADLWTGGLLASLAPGINACDQNIAEVFAAQQTLATQIDRLTEAMSVFHATPRDSSLPAYTSKLAASKKRIKKSGVDLARIAARIEEMRALVRKKEGISSTRGGGLLAALKRPSAESSPARSRAESIGAAAAVTNTATTTAAAAAAASPTAGGEASVESVPSTASTATSPDASTLSPVPAPAPTSREQIASLLNWD